MWGGGGGGGTTKYFWDAKGIIKRKMHFTKLNLCSYLPCQK